MIDGMLMGINVDLLLRIFVHLSLWAAVAIAVVGAALIFFDVIVELISFIADLF